jgi:DNA gyrase subunit B
MDREHRSLRRVRVEDGAAADAMFELLMGSEVAPRREFIVEGSARMSRDRIDV